jgi:predicted DNA-binding protein YlxM (UPF0122 family)
MPQLDKFSFATQIFWLLVLFFFIYIILIKYFLPAIYKVLKIRKEILDNLVADSTALVDEEFIARNIRKELVSVSIFKTLDFLTIFQKKLSLFKNMCNLLVIKGPMFNQARSAYRDSILALRLKKHILNYLNK